MFRALVAPVHGLRRCTDRARSVHRTPTNHSEHAVVPAAPLAHREARLRAAARLFTKSPLVHARASTESPPSRPSGCSMLECYHEQVVNVLGQHCDLVSSCRIHRASSLALAPHCSPSAASDGRSRRLCSATRRGTRAADARVAGRLVSPMADAWISCGTPSRRRRPRWLRAGCSLSCSEQSLRRARRPLGASRCSSGAPSMRATEKTAASGRSAS